MPATPATTDQILAMLAATPDRIAVLTGGLTPAQLRAEPGPEAWSATGVLAHLRSCADVWGRCIATLLAEDHPTIRPMNPTTWIRSTDYPDLDFGPSFAAFAAQRADLLAVLGPLPPEAWDRAATQVGAGAPLRRTVRSFAERLAVHERQHFRQFERTVAAVRG